MKNFILALSLLGGSFVMAAGWKCYEFTKIELENAIGEKAIPGVVVLRKRREDGSELVIKRELMPLNEKVDDAVAAANPGQQICLKGRLNFGTPAIFYAYDARF